MVTTKAKLASALTLVAIVLGFMITVQYKQSANQRQLSQTFSYNADKVKQLNQELKALQQVGQNDQKKLATVRTQLTAYEKQAAGNNQNLKNLQAQLQQDKILAGTSAVEGPGVEVTVTDGSPPAGAGPDTIDQYLAHDFYVRQIVNELFAAGAEAVDINNVRIVSTSGIFCGGPVVWVNNDRLATPYVVRAIGDPQALKSALMMAGGIVDTLKTVDHLNISPIKSEQSIKMAAYSGTTITTPSVGGN